MLEGWEGRVRQNSPWNAVPWRGEARNKRIVFNYERVNGRTRVLWNCWEGSQK